MKCRSLCGFFPPPAPSLPPSLPPSHLPRRRTEGIHHQARLCQRGEKTRGYIRPMQLGWSGNGVGEISHFFEGLREGGRGGLETGGKRRQEKKKEGRRGKGGRQGRRGRYTPW